MSINTIKFKGAVYAENTSIQVPSGTLYEVKELKSDSLEANSLSITVTSSDTSILKYKKNDKVEYFRDGKRKGIFYLQSVKRVGPNDYTLYGLSTLGRLLQMKHVGGIYTGESVATVVQEICGSVPVTVETVYAKIALYGYLPYADGVTTSARDNLVQVLFAIGAWLGTDESGVLRVEKLWDGTASTIGANRISSQNCNVEYLDPISAVEVVEHGYIPDTKEVTLFNGTAQANDLIVFSEPIHDLSATGFTILESGTNYAILSAGTGTLTGKGYLHSTRVIQRPVSVGAEENVLFVDGATLVSLVNSAAVTDRLVSYYKHREQINGIVDVSQEQVGHVVNLYHPWDKTLVSACLSEREVSISGILEANTKALVGFLPPQPESSEYFDERIILTGSGEWTVPEGVTSYTRVLIGGGQGGASGLKGGDPPAQVKTSESSHLTDNSDRYVGMLWTEGGAGGEAGLGGMGGKILIETIQNAVPGTKVPYSCGIGGAGGIYSADSSVNGSEGTATTMGGSSSNSGSHSENGYTDPTTGEGFSLKGDTGIAGSKGHGKVKEGNSYVDKPSPTITYNGVTYTQGANGGESEASNGGYKHEPYHAMGWYYDQALGGGPAAGSNGSAGGNGSGYIYSNGARVTTGRGGKGGDAVAPAKETTGRGKGGKGGNGGGGGGSAGRGSSWQRWPNEGYTVNQANLDASSGGSNGGGKGSDGGQGGDGCIILYYRKSKPLSAGWFKDKSGKPMLERLDKRFIV